MFGYNYFIQNLIISVRFNPTLLLYSFLKIKYK